MKSVTSVSSPILTGIMATMVLVLIGSFITSLIMQFSDISESSMPYFSYTINGLSLLIGGVLAGKKGGQRGWYYGGLTGVAYFILLVFIGFLAFDVTPPLYAFIYLSLSFVIGALGGIFGVNLSS